MGKGGTAPCIPNLSNRWWWEASFTPGEGAPQYPLGKKLGSPPSQSKCGGEVKDPCQKSDLGNPAHSLVIILTKLPWEEYQERCKNCIIWILQGKL